MDNLSKFEFFLKVLFESCVSYPKDVVFRISEDEQGLFIKLKINQSDMPFFIGKQGLKVKSVRGVIQMACMNIMDKKCFLKVLESDESFDGERPEKLPPFPSDKDLLS